MSTRAGQLFCAVSAKSHLMKLLNQHAAAASPSGITKGASKKELRAAYLQEITRIHPDRAQCSTEKADNHSKFILLRQAWEAYDKESAAKDRTVDADSEGNFTDFGVGCSFSDSEEEREKRWAIMDQACKGWFPDGSLESGEAKGG
uniref:J domain-containing protein n=1 Tax=Leptocylindrus danicus TaxID=163516 RepID=A0A7S2L331_9STRA|mmetsp:Transcript_30126/g.44275  ORF Transcript_30126/g.44275 Transcript_30126/m.44275 type:complete len:146 (+) Transcript_30126:38-475(+)|eukprot:CAMPEP_0116013058 /NCGR_PEP_ID=MMETSP0321-20121206/5500_1 /TAXON_ID=163516 /ORGANISM="Leptocylindrus danicus var. danicus, Strain B650" /LENGTH=145 /DNA_ID=CAMNT_0003482535 /DNA_START=28 /DNA_END=465 /DNA_ORIENTATION=-